MTDSTQRAELGEAYERSRLARPGLSVRRADFTAHLESKLEEAPPGTRVEDLNVSDLYLAYACAQGDAVALAGFEEEIVAHVPSFVRRLRLPAATVDEVQQLLRAKLLMRGPDGGPAKILGYAGRSSLASWVRVAAVRTGLDLGRGRANAGTDDDDADLASPVADLEVEHLRACYGRHFEKAIGEAATALSPRQRALLRMQHVDGLNGEQIASVYGVNRSTASRWLATAHEALLDEVRRLLMVRQGLTSSEFDSLARVIRSSLHVSVRHILPQE
jgi:RNA polymerase sigma-70 factor (ECF subfamily)